MQNPPPKDLETTLVGASAGAVAGFLVALLNNRWRLWRLHRRLRLEPMTCAGSHVFARVHNGYIYPLNSVFVYITIEHEPSDIVAPPFSAKAFVTDRCPSKVYEADLVGRLQHPFLIRQASIYFLESDRL